jgi:tol-pal system protein YbgF
MYINFIFSILLLFSTASSASSIKSRSFEQSYDISNNHDQIESMQREIQNLTSKVEKLERSLQDIRKKIETKNVANDDPEVETPMVPSDSGKSDAPKVEKVSKGSEKQIYDAALSALKGNDYSFAVKKFEEFVSSYPDSQLLSNAYFWYGEAFLKQKSLDKAALQFLKSYKSSPKGPKSSDSLIKLATTLAELKKNTDACGILNKLDNEFPSRSEASVKKSKELRTKLKCN